MYRPILTPFFFRFSTLPHHPTPLSHALSSTLDSCSTMEDLKQIHSQIITSGLSQEIQLTSRIIKFCSISPSGSIDYALHVLAQLRFSDSFTFNTIIKGYIRRNRPAEAIGFFRNRMLKNAIPANNYTYPLLINASARSNRIHEGEFFHCRVIKLGFDSVLPVGNALVHMYGECGCLDVARQLFDEMPQRDLVSWNTMVDGYAKYGDLGIASSFFWEMPLRNVVSWNTLLSGYVQSRRFKKAFVLFKRMQESKQKPDDATLVGLLAACVHLRVVLNGKSVHGFLIRNGFSGITALDTSLIDFYCKCKRLESAHHVFERMFQRDLICWNALISGFGTRGRGKDAIALFDRMVDEDIRPDDITFVGVLTACAHTGLVDEGIRHFNGMISVFNIKPKFAHYWCMADLFARVGSPDEAMRIIKEMPLDDQSSILGALVALARLQGETSVGEYVGKNLIELEPYNSSRYALLMNVYAAAGQWNEYNKMYEVMKERGLKKQPEYTLIDLNNLVHEFSLGDRSQPEIRNIQSILEALAKHLKLPAATDDEVLNVPKEA